MIGNKSVHQECAFFLGLALWASSLCFATSTRSAESIAFLQRALEAYERGDWTATQKDVDASFDEDPHSEETCLLKALVLAHEGHPEEAQRYLKKAAEVRPHLAPSVGQKLEQDLKVLLDFKPAPASAHFTFELNGQYAQETASDLSRSLENLYLEFSSRLPERSGAPIAVKVYGPETAWQDWKTPVWWGGFYDSRDGSLRLRTDDPPGGHDEKVRRLRHQLVHAFLHGLAIPLWFEEGCAAYMEEPMSASVKIRKESLDRFLQGAPAYPLLRVQGILIGPPVGSAERTVVERRCEAMLCRLVEGYGEAAVKDLLRRVRQGADFKAEFEALTRRSSEQFFDQAL